MNKSIKVITRLQRSGWFSFRRFALTALTLAFLATPDLVRAGTVVGTNGVSLSIYANPFDPNLDFNAVETSASYGEPASGTPGSWSVVLGSTPLLLHAVDRRDGRNFQNNYEAARLIRNDTSAASAFLQYQAPSPFSVGTIVTAHSIGFSGFVNPQPYTLKFNNGSPGTTTAAWAPVPAATSGLGLVNTHPITVTTHNLSLNDTMRIEFGSSSVFPGAGNSQVAFNEVVVLPEQLEKLTAIVTAQSAGGVNMQGSVDGQGGDLSNIWYDQSGADPTTKFFELTISNPRPIAGMVLFGDDLYPGQKLRIRKDGAGGTIIGEVTFDLAPVGVEVLPIKFDTLVSTSVLRFEWLQNSPAFGGSAVSMREVVLLGVPEPSAVSLLALGGLVLWKRARRR